MTGRDLSLPGTCFYLQISETCGATCLNYFFGRQSFLYALNRGLFLCISPLGLFLFLHVKLSLYLLVSSLITSGIFQARSVFTKRRCPQLMEQDRKARASSVYEKCHWHHHLELAAETNLPPPSVTIMSQMIQKFHQIQNYS